MKFLREMSSSPIGMVLLRQNPLGRGDNFLKWNAPPMAYYMSHSQAGHKVSVVGIYHASLDNLIHSIREISIVILIFFSIYLSSSSSLHVVNNESFLGGSGWYINYCRLSPWQRS